MELSPEQVCAVPGERITFTCSARSRERLTIEFLTSALSSPVSRQPEPQAIAGDSTARYSWGAVRMWTLVLDPDTSITRVTCRVSNVAGVMVGQLHARVYTGDLSLVLRTNLLYIYIYFLFASFPVSALLKGVKYLN